VTLTDPLPADTTFVSAEQLSGPAFTCTPLPPVGGTGTITCTAASMAPGTATFRFVFHVSPTATGPLTNTASVSSPTDTSGGNNSSGASAAVLPPSADVEITKTANGSTFPPGSSVTYTIVVTNIGSFAAQATEVTDLLSPQLTLASATTTQGTCNNASPVVCTIGTLEPAASATITIIATLSPAASGGIANTATVTAANDVNPANNSSTASISTAAASIPTLSEYALLMLIAVFAAIGMVTLKR
jgi:uncharacterized repeat protein (TIGR01451 family)